MPDVIGWMHGGYISCHIGKAGVFRRMESVVQASNVKYFVLCICYLRMYTTIFIHNLRLSWLAEVNLMY